MFESIKNFFKGAWNRMFNKSTIEKPMNVQVAISSDMTNAIDLWLAEYLNNAPWVNNKTVFSMNLAAGIASEFAKLVTIEFKSEISNNEFLNEEYQAVIDNIRNIVEFACAGGAVCLKPYLSNGHIEVDIVQANNFYPVSFNSRGEVTACVLPETKTIGEYTYTRLEYHNFNAADNTQTIMNKAFKRKNNAGLNLNNDQLLGDEVLLTEVEEWAELAPMGKLINVERPLFVYFKMPHANTIDINSPLGVSVYARVAESNGLLQKADERYSQIDWEYKGSELAIDVGLDMLKPYESGKLEMPAGKDRLYRKLDIDPMADKTSMWNIFSPAIRDASLYNGLQHILRNIEFLVGLAYGTISDPNESDKTATEIKSSKQRSYQTVKDIQNNLKVSLENLAYAMWYWGVIGKLPVNKGQFQDEKDMSFDFDDSIVVDHENEIASMQTDVSLGIIDSIYYIMKKYKVDRKKAMEMQAAAPEPKPSVFPEE